MEELPFSKNSDLVLLEVGRHSVRVQLELSPLLFRCFGFALGFLIYTIVCYGQCCRSVLFKSLGSDSNF